MRSRRVVLSTWGSFGDLHPYIALGLGLRSRGHEPVIATCEIYREKVQKEGLEFAPLPPHLPHPDQAPEVMRRVMDSRDGSRHVVQDLVAPAVRDQFNALMPLLRNADFMVSHPITYGAPIAATVSGTPWAGALLQPMILASAYDPPWPVDHHGVARLVYGLGPGVTRQLMSVVRTHSRNWVAPVDALRAELGLPRGANPIFEGQYSPHLNLLLFSSVLTSPQPDWPSHSVVTGFPFYDRREAGEGTPQALTSFLDSGPAPLLFTLGSSAVMMGSEFFRDAVAIAERLNMRAVLLAGRQEWNRLPADLPPSVCVCEYAPHGEVMPRAAVVIHQGGVGTTGQALRSGRPQLVAPFAHDQGDNGARVRRLGCGAVLTPSRFRASTAVAALTRILGNPEFARSAAEVGARVRQEAGVERACDEIERVMSRQ